MTTTVCSAPACDKPAHNGYLCTTCTVTLRNDLKAVPDLLQDLEVTISRQDRIGQSSEGRKTDERPLPLRVGPMESKRELTMKLASWVSYLVSDYAFTASTTAAQLSEFLLAHVTDIQLDENAGTLADEIGYVVITAQRAVDKPLQLVYAGPCGEINDGHVCTTDLYAHPRRTEVSCRDCGATFNISERRAWLLEQVDNRLLTATEMSRALPSLLQQQLTSAMIRGWAHRGKLDAHPPLPDRPKDPVYRVGDVIALVKAKVEEGRLCA